MLMGQQIRSCVIDSTWRSLLFVTSTSCVITFFAQSGYSMTWNRRLFFTSKEKLPWPFLHMLKGFLTSAEVLVFFPRKFHHCFWWSNHHLIYHRQRIPWLTPDVIPFLAHWIPFESEQKQKFQITKSPPVLHRHEKYSLTLDNFSLSSLQLVPN